jgi:hypothetical protein
MHLPSLLRLGSSGGTLSQLKQSRLYIDLSSPESCVLFLEGMRALNLYEDETGKHSPSSKRLQEFLQEAYQKLDESVRVYPGDRIPHFYYAIVLTLKNQEIYASRLREMIPALVAEGRVLAFRQQLHQIEPALDLAANSWPPAPDKSAAWVRARFTEEKEAATSFCNLIEEEWPLLAEAAHEFELVQTRGPEQLENTAAYNLAQVCGRLGGAASLRRGLDVLNQIHLKPSLSKDDRALALQIDVLRHSLRARELMEVRGEKSEFDKTWTALREMDDAVKFSGLSSAYEIDLHADYLVKSGYVLYDQAMHDYFIDSPSDTLSAAANRFSEALFVRKSWNQAQLYLAITHCLQSGVASGQLELQEEFETLPSPSTDFKEQIEQGNQLFESLLGKVVVVENAPKPSLSEAEAFLKAARQVFHAIQRKDVPAILLDKSPPQEPDSAEIELSEPEAEADEE